MPYRIIFFDLDGTLTDPEEGITRAVQYALARFGIHEGDRARLRPFIGPPLLGSFMADYGFDEPQARQAIDYYREYFGRQGMYENLLYPGIPELLTQLRATGRTLYVVTSKPTHFAVPIVAHFGLTHHFARVIGSELDLSNADKPTLVRLARELHPAEETAAFVMIGDREHDISGARANGIASIGVTYGMGDAAELVAARPTWIAHSVAELAAILG